jgi:large subunit ribosomal protein L31e
MAETTKPKKKEEKSEVVLERVYNVPLRKEWLKAPKYKRAKKAVKALKEFIAKHMKSDDVKVGKFANLEIWKHGIKNPPHHIKVKAVKDNKGSVKVELEGVKLKEKVPSILKKSRAKEEKKPKKAEASEVDKKLEQVKEAQQEDAKEIEKEELKELKEESKPKSEHAPKKEQVEKKTEAKPNAPANK